MQQLDVKAGGDHGAYHLSERVVPFVGYVVHRLGLEVGVGARLVPHPRLLVLEVVVLHTQVVVTEDLGEGMELRQVQEASGFDQLSDNPGPPLDVGEPVQSAAARVDDVEGFDPP